MSLGNQKYLDIALQNAHFTIKNLWSDDGNLFHNYKNEKSKVNNYLEDYRCVIAAFIALDEANLDEKWLNDAKQITDYSLEHFYDGKKSFFAFTSNLDQALITTHYETEDNIIPASNSVMAKNLFQLSIYFNNSYYEKVSRQMILALLPGIDYPSAFSNWIDLALNYSEQNKELAVCGQEALAYCAKINSQYIPNAFLARTGKESSLPFL